MNYLGEPKKLIEWLSDSAAYPADGWLYLKADVTFLGLVTMCWPGVVESIELSDDEYDKMESWLEENGYNSFLSKDQIDDIASNLAQQLSPYTDNQLLQAVQYYWENDAFLNAKNA